MPTLDAPGHYDRSSGIADGVYDDFFKMIPPDYYIDDFGSVEFPLGWVGLILLDKGTIDSLMEIIANPEAYSVPERGWYNVRHDDNGLVWGIMYGEDSTFNEERARSDFNEGLQAWVDWSDAHDEV